MHVALWEPEIPPNAGNVARLCAATGSRLHLIGRLGFRLDDKHLKRAGLDYWPRVDLHRHDTLAAFEESFAGERPGWSRPEFEAQDDSGRDQPGRSPRLWVVETPAPTPYTRAAFRPGDALLFGPESRGLPESVRERYADSLIHIPMLTDAVRSLNLATAVAIVLYEALRRQHDW